MEISYWKSRWGKNNIGWHMDIVYPPLAKLWNQLSIKSDARVLVPLCGKSLDLQWLAEQGHHVTGVEVSRKALQQVMQQYPEEFTRDASHGFTIYRSNLLELWEGDFLKLPAHEISAIDIIYDKASIVALPPEMRTEYVSKLVELSNDSTQMLLQTFEYDQAEMTGPPFSVDEQEVKNHFSDRFEIALLHEQSKLDELEKLQQRGLSSYLREKVYHLTPLHRG